MDLALASPDKLTWENWIHTNEGMTMRCVEHPRITCLHPAFVTTSAFVYYVDGDKLCSDWSDVQALHDQPPVLTGEELDTLKRFHSNDIDVSNTTVETRRAAVLLLMKGCIDDDMRPTVLGLLVMSALSGGA